MKILIAGGTGFIGQSIIENWMGKKVDFHLLSTDQRKCDEKNIHYWDGESIGPWIEVLKQCDVLINLSGKSVNCRYNASNKEAILKSRISTTRVLGDALSLLDYPPTLWINASTGTIYRDEYIRPNTEANGVLGEGFSVEVAKAWESEFFKYKHLPIRQVALRTGFVLGERGELLHIFKKHALLGLNQRHGKGNQMISWIHEVDLVRAINYIIWRSQLTGVVNLCSPCSLTDKDFLATFRKVLNVSYGISMPRWMLHIGAVICRSEVELLLKSRWYYPEKLLHEGFEFEYPSLHKCLENLFKDQMDTGQLSFSCF